MLPAGADILPALPQKRTAVSMNLSSLTATLRRAQTFEDGARAALELVLPWLEGELTGARALRGMIHLRPGGVYRGLVVLERQTNAQIPDLVPSASAWQALSRDPRPMVIDVAKASARVPGDVEQIDTKPLFSMRTTQTIARLRSRMATLMLALPLQGNDDVLLGVVSIELNTEALRAQPGVVDACTTQLQGFVDIIALALPNLPVQTAPAPTHAEKPDPMMPVVGEKMRQVLRLLRVFAQQDETLLLSGETGVGKSQLAQWCHAQSAVRSGPLEAVVLSTLPEEMQLPSLFGWKRGAFTGAVKDSPGAVLRAQGGTLFIDEIDKLSPRAQAGLLQLLESRQYRPVGDPGRLKTADVRFIVGTNIDLAVAVQEGRFLEDLFFRINVLPVQIPSLAQRLDEIPGWVNFMAQRRHRKSGMRGALIITEGASALLSAQPWPGNLRQLNNAVRRTYAVMLADGVAKDGRLRLQQRHVEQALSMDLARQRAPTASPPPAGLVPALDAAAQALLDALAQHPDQRESIFLLADAFSALVLHHARVQAGDIKDAYVRLGREGLVSSRSHHKDFRRRIKRLGDLLVKLGLPVDETLAASLKV